MTDNFCFALLRTTVLQILQAAGYESAHMDPTNILTDVMKQYLELLAATTSSYAQLAGRTTGNLWDVMDCLVELDVEPETLRDWLLEDGKALTPSWSEQSDPGRTLEGIVRKGRSQQSEHVLIYEYATIPDEDELELYEDLAEDSLDNEEDNVPASPPPIVNNDLPDYIPSYLPPFPSENKDEPGSPAVSFPQSAPKPLPLAASAQALSPSNGPAPILVRNKKKPIDNPFTHVVPFEESMMATEKNDCLSLVIKGDENGNVERPASTNKRRRVGLSNSTLKAVTESLNSEQHDPKRKSREGLSGTYNMFREFTQDEAAPGNNMFGTSSGILTELLRRVALPSMVSKLSTPNLLVDVAVTQPPPQTPVKATRPSTNGAGGSTLSSSASQETAPSTPTASNGPPRSNSISLLASLAGGQYNRKHSASGGDSEPTGSIKVSIPNPVPNGTSASVTPTSISLTARAPEATASQAASSKSAANTPKIRFKIKPPEPTDKPAKATPPPVSLSLSQTPTVQAPPQPSPQSQTQPELSSPAIIPPVPAADSSGEIINCICDNPTVDYGMFMIACDKCGVWFHGNCVGISESDQIEEWFCGSCRP